MGAASLEEVITTLDEYAVFYRPYHYKSVESVRLDSPLRELVSEFLAQKLATFSFLSWAEAGSPADTVFTPNNLLGNNCLSKAVKTGHFCLCLSAAPEILRKGYKVYREFRHCLRFSEWITPLATAIMH